MFKMPKAITKGINVTQLRDANAVKEALDETCEKAIVVMNRNEPKFVIVEIEKWEQIVAK